MDMNETAGLAERLSDVRARIHDAAAKGGRSGDEVTLVAVTKTHPAEVVAAAVELGVQHAGENRVQEALLKIRALQHLQVNWHLIGHLQSNKAKHAVEHFGLIHSVDSTELAMALNRQAAKAGKRQQILLQANVSGEESKFGLRPGAVPFVLESIVKECPSLEVLGFMTMAPLVEDPELARSTFEALRNLSETMKSQFSGSSGFRPQHLSMGMTNDFEVAIEEGATMVRIGSAIFGAR